MAPPPHFSSVQLGALTFDACFDGGNGARVEQTGQDEFAVWTNPDAAGTQHEKQYKVWFSFAVRGVARGRQLTFVIHNMNNLGKLFRHDMRPVFRSVVSNKKWARIQSPARFTKSDGAAQLYFEHSVEHDEDKIYFAFTYPYTYTTMQNDLDQIERKHENDFNDKERIYFYREVVLKTPDGLNMDLVTITSIEGIDPDRRSEEIDGLFCCRETSHDSEYFGALDFPNKEIVYLSYFKYF